VLLALAIHGFVTLPLALQFLGKRSVPAYAKAMSTPLMTAFSTSSSSATLPLTMESLIEEAKVSRRVVSFVVPLGATINMNGTALYEAVAAMFIAQTYGIEMGLGETIIVLLTATLSAIGAAGIPEAGLVTMVIVLKAVDLPIEGISLILVVDWFLDRCRTSVNVWGDAVGAAVIDRLETQE
jgi:Na+/H+-dicarboxylate symporter